MAQSSATLSFEQRMSAIVPRNTHRSAPFSEVDLQQIQALLQGSGKHSWAKRPGIYAILRSLGCLDLMQGFIVDGLADNDLPLMAEYLPEDLNDDESLRDGFIRKQKLVLDAVQAMHNSIVEGGSDKASQKKPIPGRPQPPITTTHEHDVELHFDTHPLLPPIMQTNSYLLDAERSSYASSVNDTLCASTESGQQTPTGPSWSVLSSRVSNQAQVPRSASPDGGSDKIFRQATRSEKIAIHNLRQASGTDKIVARNGTRTEKMPVLRTGTDKIFRQSSRVEKIPARDQQEAHSQSNEMHDATQYPDTRRSGSMSEPPRKLNPYLYALNFIIPTSYD